MKFNEEDFRKVYQQELARRERQLAECPSTGTFERMMAGDIDRVERERVADHLIVCSGCAREYRDASSLKMQLEKAFSDTPAVTPSQTRERFTWPGWRIAGAVAAIFIIVAVPLTLWLATQPTPTPPSTERGNSSVKFNVSPSDKSILDEVPQKLEWSVVERAESYRVSLYDFQSTLVWESPTLRETSATLPKTVRASLQSGKPYYWQITIREGVERRPSDVFQFTISDDAHR